MCMAASVKERAIHIIEGLPAERLVEALHLLEGLAAGDPVLAALACAPEDDEPYSEEEEREDEEAIAAYQRGQFVTQEEVIRRSRAERTRAAR